MSTYEELLEHIETLEIIDTHEHLPMENLRPKSTDVLSEYLTHYFSCDLVSAGLSYEGLGQAKDSSKDLTKRWDIVEPYWEAARSTGYGRSLDIAAKGLYDIDGVNRATLPALNKAFLAAREKGGHYHYVLKEKSRIALSVLDSWVDCDREFFASVFRLDDFIMPGHRSKIRNMGNHVGVKVHRLEDWEETARLLLDEVLAKGVIGLKSGLAYVRPLHYAKVDIATAQREFNEFFHESNSPDWRSQPKPGRALQDYMMHSVCRLADQRGLTFQIHTGLQEGHGNVIGDANPTHLANLFLEYENVKFDIFHMGYPYMLELSSLAKNFRNVFIDMCWGHIISPQAARTALVEWLDAVPANKISAFGGDYCFIDGVYGHQKLARQNVAASLAQKVADGSFDLDRARQIATWVFVDNPTALFNLAPRLKKKAAAGKKKKKK